MVDKRMSGPENLDMTTAPSRPLDATDRRMMAIDHHITTSKNHELAREIEALREEK